MHEQLRVLWKSRDKELSFVSGRLLAKNALNTNCSQPNLLTKKWFTLVGHSLFFCTYKDSPDYSDVYLTDLFGPAIARVDQKILDTFDIPEEQQVRITNFYSYTSCSACHDSCRCMIDSVFPSGNWGSVVW